MASDPASSITRFGGKTAEQQMLSGSVWMMAMRWAIRGIGLLSTLILARLLAPEDFGVVAMTVASMQILTILFTESGLRLALIRHPDPQPSHYDTAWTLGLLCSFLVGGLIFAVAPLVADFYDEPLVAELMRLLALVPLIHGLESIRVVDLQKRLRFAADFRFNVAVKLSGFVVTVGLALWLQDYRALVWGMVGGAVARAAVSYVMAPYLPRPTLVHTRALFGFSIWVLISHLGEHTADLADRLIAGRLFGAQTVGFYHVASELAVAPARELTVSVGRALRPVYARLLDDPGELGRQYAGALGVIAGISLPATFGLALVADDAVPLVLGEKWQASAPLIAWLAPGFALHFLTRTNYTVLHVLGYARRAALLRWPLVAVVVVSMYLGGRWYGIEGVAGGRFLALLLFLPLPFLVTGRLVHLGMGDFVGALWRPLLACGAMATAVLLGHQEQLALPWRLAIDVAVGALAYVGASLLLWRLAGRPDGLESFVVARLRLARLVPGAVP